VEQHLSSADRSPQSRRHCQNGWRLARQRPLRDFPVQAQGPGSHRDKRRRAGGVAATSHWNKNAPSSSHSWPASLKESR
jgi:hypothetical protein